MFQSLKQRSPNHQVLFAIRWSEYYFKSHRIYRYHYIFYPHSCIQHSGNHTRQQHSSFKSLSKNMTCCGRQKEPAILISTLLLQTHAQQLYSLVLTRFCWNLESSTTNAWNAKNAIFTFGPWITWTSCIAAALTNLNRACQLGFDFSVHIVALYAISRPYSVFWLNQHAYFIT